MESTTPPESSAQRSDTSGNFENTESESSEGSSPESCEDSSSEPTRFCLLSDVYDNTEEIEISDELLFASADEPTIFA